MLTAPSYQPHRQPDFWIGNRVQDQFQIYLPMPPVPCILGAGLLTSVEIYFGCLTALFLRLSSTHSFCHGSYVWSLIAWFLWKQLPGPSYLGDKPLGAPGAVLKPRESLEYFTNWWTEAQLDALSKGPPPSLQDICMRNPEVLPLAAPTLQIDGSEMLRTEFRWIPNFPGMSPPKEKHHSVCVCRCRM